MPAAIVAPCDGQRSFPIQHGEQSCHPTSKPTCQVMRPSDSYQGKQALFYEPGVSADTVGAKGLHMQISTLPPLARAKAHKHAEHETAIYVMSGH